MASLILDSGVRIYVDYRMRHPMCKVVRSPVIALGGGVGPGEFGFLGEAFCRSWGSTPHCMAPGRLLCAFDDASGHRILSFDLNDRRLSRTECPNFTLVAHTCSTLGFHCLG